MITYSEMREHCTELNFGVNYSTQPKVHFTNTILFPINRICNAILSSN